MFTGIIESLGVVKSVRPGGGGQVLSVDVGDVVEGAGLGDSIAINGVCLTISRISGSVCDFDVSGETLEHSTIGKLRAGDRVNLERAMAADGRFGGHIVQGHVDGSAEIRSIATKGEFAEIEFAAKSGVLDEMVVKGSVCVDGVSLTVAKLGRESFGIAVIPTTLKETTLGNARVGDVVNIETDIITRTIRRQMEKMLGDKGSGLTMEKLREHGF